MSKCMSEYCTWVSARAIVDDWVMVVDAYAYNIMMEFATEEEGKACVWGGIGCSIKGPALLQDASIVHALLFNSNII